MEYADADQTVRGIERGPGTEQRTGELRVKVYRAEAQQEKARSAAEDGSSQCGASEAAASGGHDIHDIHLRPKVKASGR
jgi:hypothetical protein